MMPGRRRLVPLALAALTIQALLGLLLARIYLTSQNTLHNNGRWVSTKTLVSRPLLGATSFVRERQALAGNQLDLSAWHGHQEVLLDREWAIQQLELDFELAAGAWLVVYLDKPAKRPASALRFGTVRQRPSAHLEVTPQGEFLARQPFKPYRVAPATRYHLEVRYSEESVEARLDGRELGEFPLPSREVRRVGFRGSAREVLVDNVAVRDASGLQLRERFDGPRHSRRIELVVVGSIVALNVLVGVVLLRRARRPGRLAGFVFVMVTTTLIVIAALMLGFLSLRGRTYPLADNLEEAERQTRHREIERIRAQVARRYGLSGPEPGLHRILLVGSSQTWGSGAARPRHVWSEVLEERLNGDPELAGHFECINAGIASARSFHLSKALEEDWSALEPETVVINLGTNDTNLEAFALHIERMIGLSRDAGAEPLLILEPNSTEHWDGPLSERHAILLRIGNESQVPVIDMHGYLGRRADDGFLWWDLAHLTSFGQRLFAEKLHEELVRLQLVE
jgi:lysophospholipase L1-like esterase